MKHFSLFWKSFAAAIRTVHLVDRCLLVIMAILLAQSAYGLFTHASGTLETNHIDIIVRTSAAAIFGYFISENFNRKSTDPATSTVLQNVAPPGISPPEQIDLIAPDIPAPPVVVDAQAEAHPASDSCQQVQILVVFTVGVISLCLLLLFRNFMSMSSSAIATLSQLRDFVSACVGFLIGSATGENPANTKIESAHGR